MIINYKKLLLLTIISLSSPCYSYELTGQAKLSRVIDGDTIEVQLQQTKAKVRLAGIDCFETSKIHRAYKQAYLNKMTIDEVMFKGYQAKGHLNNMLYGNKNIKIKILGIDKYGRLLGIVYDSENRNINQVLINYGICPEY